MGIIGEAWKKFSTRNVKKVETEDEQIKREAKEDLAAATKETDRDRVKKERAEVREELKEERESISLQEERQALKERKGRSEEKKKQYDKEHPTGLHRLLNLGRKKESRPAARVIYRTRSKKAKTHKKQVAVRTATAKEKPKSQLERHFGPPQGFGSRGGNPGGFEAPKAPRMFGSSPFKKRRF